MQIQNNWAFQNDQSQFINGLKRSASRLPRIMRGKVYSVIHQADDAPTFENNTAARKAVAEAQARADKSNGYLAGFKVPAKVINSKELTRKLASEMAMACYKDMIDCAEGLPVGLPLEKAVEKTYETVGRLSLERIPQIIPPYWEMDTDQAVKECSLLKLQSEKWWARKLARLRKQHLETLELIAGNVGRKVSPYASKRTVREFIRDKEAQRRWAESLLLINEQGDELELIKAIDASIANPENARAELMKRIRGLEEYADELGFKAVFLTLTAPSRMHPGAKHWDGSTPKDTNAYLVKTWARARAKLKREKMVYFGVRVSEPHQDAAPHWHGLFFLPKENIKKFCRIVRAYFCAEDKAELIARFKNRKALRKAWRQARKKWGFAKKNGKKVAEPRRFYMPFQPRFDAELIDTSKGSAAAYIAKYISKNINAFEVADLIDKETGKEIGAGVVSVKAWASTWNIRQFQFQGCDPITAYREIRRIRQAFTDENAKELEQLRQAAESNNFIDFIKAMKVIDAKLQYEVIPYGNEYGEAVKKLKGIAAGNVTALTRAQKWQMSRRSALKVGDSQQSWTSGANCTQLTPTQGPDVKRQFAGFSAEAIALLQRGYTVNLYGEKYRLRYGAVSLVGRDDLEPKHPPSKPLKTQSTEGIKPLWH